MPYIWRVSHVEGVNINVRVMMTTTIATALVVAEVAAKKYIVNASNYFSACNYNLPEN